MVRKKLTRARKFPCCFPVLPGFCQKIQAILVYVTLTFDL